MQGIQSVHICCKRLREGVLLPRYHSDQAAGLDLQAWPEEGQALPIRIVPFSRVLIPTGLSISIPKGYEGQVRPRSGLALRQGITVLNSPGTIDSDYRGELLVLLINLGQEEVCIFPGDRIAQLVIVPVAHATLVEVEVLEQTARGAGGYGHTGSS